MELHLTNEEIQYIVDALKIARLNYLRLSQVGCEQKKMLNEATVDQNLIELLSSKIN